MEVLALKKHSLGLRAIGRKLGTGRGFALMADWPEVETRR
jgi:hypothetical protein